MKSLLLAVALTLLCSYEGNSTSKKSVIEDNTIFASGQTLHLLENVGKPTGENYPRTTDKEGMLTTTRMDGWTSGFFPGSLWYLYELTGAEQWKNVAEQWTHTLEPLKTFTKHHDLGFMMYCSYGNAQRLNPKDEYLDILRQSATSLASRYNDTTKTIKSWNGFKPWDGETVYQYPVIIDNMMNLEMLFYAWEAFGDKRFYDIAVSHADATLKNHFREDFSTYHVVNYDPLTGDVVSRKTAQGYSDNSVWARGQAWAIYGFTMTYRWTKDERYLAAAAKAADLFVAHLPEDLIPYWDFNVGQEGYEPGERSNAVGYKEKTRDVSAGAIVCSALFELGELTGKSGYTDTAVNMLHSLASPTYRAKQGTNGGFLLMHSVGSIPHKSEIDVPLVYADYYFLEALTRYKRID